MATLQDRAGGARAVWLRLGSWIGARLAGRGGQWRSVATLMTGTVGAQAIGVASMLMLARIYTPADFGIYAFFFVVAGLLAMLSTGAYEQAVFVASASQDAAEVAALAMALSCTSALLLLFVSPTAGALLVKSEATRLLDGLLPVLALAVAGGGCLSALNALAVQQQSYAAVSRSRLAQALVAATASIGLGVWGLGGDGLVIGFVVGQVAAVGVLAASLIGAVAPMDRRKLWGHVREHSRFPRYMLASGLFNYIGNNLVALVTPSHFGTATLGQYNLGQRVAGLPISIVGGAMGEVFRGGISPQHAKPEEVTHLFRAAALRLAGVGLALTIPLLLAGPALFELVLGARWREAGVCMQILAPMIFARFVVSPLSVVLVLAGQQRLDAILQALFTVAALAAILVGVAFASFWTMIALMSMAHTLLYGIYFLASDRAARSQSSAWSTS